MFREFCLPTNAAKVPQVGVRLGPLT